MQQLHRHSEIPFGLEFLVMDPGYRPENRQGGARGWMVSSMGKGGSSYWVYFGE